MKSHVRTHTGSHPFARHLCAKTFTQKQNLTRHLKAQHGVVMPKASYDRNPRKKRSPAAGEPNADFEVVGESNKPSSKQPSEGGTKGTRGFPTTSTGNHLNDSSPHEIPRRTTSSSVKASGRKPKKLQVFKKRSRDHEAASNAPSSTRVRKSHGRASPSPTRSFLPAPHSKVSPSPTGKLSLLPPKVKVAQRGTSGDSSASRSPERLPTTQTKESRRSPLTSAGKVSLPVGLASAGFQKSRSASYEASLSQVRNISRAPPGTRVSQLDTTGDSSASRSPERPLVADTCDRRNCLTSFGNLPLPVDSGSTGSQKSQPVAATDTRKSFVHPKGAYSNIGSSRDSSIDPLLVEHCHEPMRLETNPQDAHVNSRASVPSFDASETMAHPLDDLFNNDTDNLQLALPQSRSVRFSARRDISCISSPPIELDEASVVHSISEAAAPLSVAPEHVIQSLVPVPPGDAAPLAAPPENDYSNFVIDVSPVPIVTNDDVSLRPHIDTSNTFGSGDALTTSVLPCSLSGSAHERSSPLQKSQATIHMPIEPDSSGFVRELSPIVEFQTSLPPEDVSVSSVDQFSQMCASSPHLHQSQARNPSRLDYFECTQNQKAGHNVLHVAQDLAQMSHSSGDISTEQSDAIAFGEEVREISSTVPSGEHSFALEKADVEPTEVETREPFLTSEKAAVDPKQVEAHERFFMPEKADVDPKQVEVHEPFLMSEKANVDPKDVEIHERFFMSNPEDEDGVDDVSDAFVWRESDISRNGSRSK